MEKLAALKARQAEIHDLKAAAYLLEWDQATYMPAGGGPARARQIALLEGLAHERLTDPDLGRLLDDLGPYESSLPYDSDDASLIRIVRRQYEMAARVPTGFVTAAHEHFANTFQAWSAARPANDFRAVQPFLEKSLELSRRFAGFFPDHEHVADPLIAHEDYGLTVATLRPLLAGLRQRLVPLLQAIVARPPADASCLKQFFPAAKQWELSLEVLERMGYDFQRGRQDIAPHPFTTHFSIGDVRVTNRVREHDLGEAFSAPCTREGTHSTSRVSTLPWRAHAWRRARRPGCTRASRACGRTSWGAACPSGGSTIRACSRPFPSSWAPSPSTPSTGPSTRCSAR